MFVIAPEMSTWCGKYVAFTQGTSDQIRRKASCYSSFYLYWKTKHGKLCARVGGEGGGGVLGDEPLIVYVVINP